MIGTRPPVWLTLTVVLACTTACKEDHPYTPFQVASALPSETPKPVEPPPKAENPPTATFAATQAVVRAKAQSWDVGGVRIEAGPGYEIERALQVDFDGDHSKETLAWIVPKDDPLKRPELWLYPGQGTPKKLFALPGFVPTGPTCSLQTSLLHTGPHTVTLDTLGSCEARLIPRAPVRSIAVLAPLRQHPLILALRAAEAAPGEQLKLLVSSIDRDADGRDDVTLNVTLQTQSSSSRTATARFLWYDREAGASRDDSEPGVSLARLASTELVRARGKNTSQSVRAAIGNLKRLYGAVCDEGGTPRLFDESGAGLPCGRLTTTFSRAAQAEITALVKNDEILEAIGVLTRDAWFAHPVPDSELEGRWALMGDQLRRRNTRLVKVLNVTLPGRSTYPRLSPLDFTSRGTLLVQTASGVLEFSKDGAKLEAQPAAERHQVEDEPRPTPMFLPPPAPAAWALAMVSPGRRRWTGTVQSCDRSELTLSFVDEQGQTTQQVTDVLAPRPGNCRGGPALTQPASVPIGWSGEQLVAWAGGSWVGPKQPSERLQGSPLSPNGRWLVLPTRFGLVVRSARTELWRAPSETPAEALSQCTIDDDGRHVACVFGTRAALVAVSD